MLCARTNSRKSSTSSSGNRSARAASPARSWRTSSAISPILQPKRRVGRWTRSYKRCAKRAARVSHSYLLDTGVANLVAKEMPPALRRIATAQDVYVPAIALAELYAGAYIYAHKHNSAKYLAIHDRFLTGYQHVLLPGDWETAQIYGAIRGELTAHGALI